MFDVQTIRQDFPMLNGKTMHGKSLIYLKIMEQQH